MKSNLVACSQLQELTACEMAAVDGGNIIVDIVGGIVRFITALALAHPYCVVPMTFNRPCT